MTNNKTPILKTVAFTRGTWVTDHPVPLNHTEEWGIVAPYKDDVDEEWTCGSGVADYFDAPGKILQIQFQMYSRPSHEVVEVILEVMDGCKISLAGDMPIGVYVPFYRWLRRNVREGRRFLGLWYWQ